MTALAEEGRSLVFYEAPHRIAEFASDALAVFGAERKLAHAREITKEFEQVFRGDMQQWQQWLQEDEYHLRGEMVVVIEGVPAQNSIGEKDRAWLKALAPQVQSKELAKIAAKLMDVPKAQIYDYLLALKG